MTLERSSLTKPHKAQTIHLKVKFDNCEYVMGTLSLNLSKSELSYHLHHPVESNFNPLDLNNNKPTSRLDHVTWHKNEIHIKKMNDELVGKIEAPNGNFLPSIKQIKPIFVETFFLNSMTQHKILVPSNNFKIWAGSHEQLITNSASLSDFSFVLILIPSATPISHASETPQASLGDENAINLSCLAAPGHIVWRIDAYPEWALLGFTTPFVNNEILHQREFIPQGSIRALNYQNPSAGLSVILRQAFNHVNNLVQQKPSPQPPTPND